MEKKTKRTAKQNIALVGVILLAVMVLATLLTAIFDASGVWFRACLVVTIALPILLWVYIWLFGLTKQKDTLASFHLLQDEDGSSESGEE